jgi:hypothetical protein
MSESQLIIMSSALVEPSEQLSVFDSQLNFEMNFQMPIRHLDMLLASGVVSLPPFCLSRLDECHGSACFPHVPRNVLP